MHDLVAILVNIFERSLRRPLPSDCEVTRCITRPLDKRLTRLTCRRMFPSK